MCSKLIFEGEYLNGERSGKGIEYYSNGQLKFKGEYLNGEKWDGEEIIYDGRFIYQNKYVKGKIKDSQKFEK